ncbi:11915_t:CDS:2 [Funneliformis mosseae]|uniref:11915_t:CDS:1 n=1 Tax=Funneliformis mosseae TaxID=27381 RepID=A0A9N9IEN3_FUNMO|nr:11915_t:CDS:2 [Funneliformis mosseae]
MNGEFYVENNKEGIEGVTQKIITVEGDQVEKAGMEWPCTPEDKESRFKESKSEELGVIYNAVAETQNYIMNKKEK